MVEPIGLLAGLGALGEWLDRWMSLRKARTEAGRAAVQALLQALARTRAYIEDTGVGSVSRNREMEYELANLWSQAAGAFHGVDPNIAPLLQLKSEAWAAPSQWSEERVQAAGITIDEISSKARQFLGS